MENESENIERLLNKFTDCWCRKKPTELIKIWDENETIPFYIAEEIFDPIYGWDKLINYWQESEKILKKFSIRTYDLKYKIIEKDIAVLNFIMHWNAYLNSENQGPFGLDVRVSSLIRRIDADWKFFHYIESPLGAFPYIQEVYKSNVDDDFLEPSPPVK